MEDYTWKFREVHQEKRSALHTNCSHADLQSWGSSELQQMWTTNYHTGVVTDNTFSSSSITLLALCKSVLLLISGSVRDYIFELQHLFNQTLVSKQIYVLIKKTSSLITFWVIQKLWLHSAADNMDRGDMHMHCTECNFLFCWPSF